MRLDPCKGCGELISIFSDHREDCPKRVKTCRCGRKYKFGEYCNHGIPAAEWARGSDRNGPQPAT